MTPKFVQFLCHLILLSATLSAEELIQIDARPDSIYGTLKGPDEGFIILSHNDFLPYPRPHDVFSPYSSPKPDGNDDLSAKFWMVWDDHYLYVYAEITDDLVCVNNTVRPWNDCLELKFDPDPLQKALIGIVNARLSALDSADVDKDRLHGVDNLYSEGYLDTSEITSADYARRITDTGYALELRLKWKWIKAEGRRVNMGVGNIFGFAFNIHDNDSDRRDSSVQWSVGMSDEVWNTPQLLGTAEFLPDHKIKLIKQNSIDPAARPGYVYLSQSRLEKWKGPNILIENWLYHSGDDSQWADPAFDDRDWEVIHPVLRKEWMPESGWNNIGWFRLHVVVDSSLLGVPLGLNFRGSGAAEFYLNGDSLYQYGKPDLSADTERIEWQYKPGYIVFRDHSHHVLALRYSNSLTQKIHNYESGAGFACYLEEDLKKYADNIIDAIRAFSLYEATFVAIPLLIGLIHLLIFIFYRQVKENLFFSLTTFCWVLIVIGHLHSPFYSSFTQLLIFRILHDLAILPAIIFGLMTLYTLIYGKILKQIWIFIATGIVVAVYIFLNIRIGGQVLGIIIYFMIGLATLEIFRIMIFAGFERWQSRWLTLVGFAVFMLAVVYQISQYYLGLPRLGEYNIIYVYGLLALSILVSIDLSIKFARTSRNLEQQLDQVKKLSQKALEQERRVRKEELARKLLEADNWRKTKELEEARQLQLSMLPREIPTPDHLEIAARMKTANEVGGDYYDFYLAPDDTLTVAIGDATGHGMRAGTMVASIKSLFAAFGNHLDISRFFNRCTEIIKEMHMGNIFMGMMLVRLNGKSMTAAAAGLPPIFIHRAATGKIDEMILKGMPLGAHRGFKYTEKKTFIAPGDTILLMTDGYTELFNEKKEMLDYHRVKEYFLENASKSADKIIDELICKGEKWRGKEPQADDFTFIVIKVKE